MWDYPTMSTSTVDSKKRVVLASGKQGEVYDVQSQGEGRLLLVRLERPRRKKHMNKKACLAAMNKSPLRPTMGWDQLRRTTREP